MGSAAENFIIDVYVCVNVCVHKAANMQEDTSKQNKNSVAFYLDHIPKARLLNYYTRRRRKKWPLPFKGPCQCTILINSSCCQSFFSVAFGGKPGKCPWTATAQEQESKELHSAFAGFICQLRKSASFNLLVTRGI